MSAHEDEAAPEGGCFILMPFQPDLNFFYLYIRHSISQTYRLPCARADSRYHTGPFIDKIRKYILTKIIDDPSDSALMRVLFSWLSGQE